MIDLFLVAEVRENGKQQLLWWWCYLKFSPIVNWTNAETADWSNRLTANVQFVWPVQQSRVWWNDRITVYRFSPFMMHDNCRRNMSKEQLQYEGKKKKIKSCCIYLNQIHCPFAMLSTSMYVNVNCELVKLQATCVTTSMKSRLNFQVKNLFRRLEQVKKESTKRKKNYSKKK